MSQGLNKVILIGAVDGEPRFHRHGEGRHRLWFRLRTNELRPDEHGVMRERLGWHSVVVWGARAEGLSRLLSAGSRLAVEGRLVTRKVQKASEPRYQTEIHARELVILGREPKVEHEAA